MKRAFPVIDADGHVIEDIQQLREFLPGAFQAKTARGSTCCFLATAGCAAR